MPALMLKRSSRVMPGLRGTPAGMTTRSAPCQACSQVLLPCVASHLQSMTRRLECFFKCCGAHSPRFTHTPCTSNVQDVHAACEE